MEQCTKWLWLNKEVKSCYLSACKNFVRKKLTQLQNGKENNAQSDNLIGNLGRDPEVKQTSKGASPPSVATHRKIKEKNKQTGIEQFVGMKNLLMY